MTVQQLIEILINAHSMDETVLIDKKDIGWFQDDRDGCFCLESYK